MNILYLILCILSFVQIVIYKLKIKNTTLPMLSFFIIITIINLGYFILSISGKLEIALWANRLAYLGSAFLLYDLILIFYDICEVEIKKWAKILLAIISSLAFLLAASGGFKNIPVFYSKVSLSEENGVYFLVKEYGSLHFLYKVYIVLYFIIILFGILYCIVKKNKNRIKEAYFLLALTIFTFAIWLLEHNLHINFEFIAIIYVIGGLLLILVYSLIEEITANLPTVTLFFKDDTIDEIINSAKIDYCITEREAEVLRGILRNEKRKEIADELCVSEDTIKKHTSHIFKKYGVTSRNELFAIINQEKA